MSQLGLLAGNWARAMDRTPFDLTVAAQLWFARRDLVICLHWLWLGWVWDVYGSAEDESEKVVLIIYGNTWGSTPTPGLGDFIPQKPRKSP